MKTTIAFVLFVACPLTVLSAIAIHARSVSECRVSTSTANLRLLHNAVRQFRMDTGRLPTAKEGLDALVHQPADVHNWLTGGYLETSKVPKDHWGNNFHYVLDPNLPGGFGIYSCGEDGVTSSRGNDRDDMNTWGTSSSESD